MDNIESLPLEQWKEYCDVAWDKSSAIFISNYGRVKSYKLNKNGTLLKCGKTNNYKVVCGKRLGGGSVVNRYLHRIVASLFVPKPNGYNLVIHKDYDFENNASSNLKWVDEKGKREHQKNNPLKDGPNAKLTETQVIRLKRLLLDPNRKTRYKILARQFGVSEMQLHRIKTGENWGHVKI